MIRQNDQNIGACQEMNNQLDIAVNIIEAIDGFINNRIYHYALLINGKWGSGKTYYVKKTIIPHIKESGRDVNYLSLYGIKSTDEISQMLCIQAIKDKTPEMAKTVLDSKGGQITMKMLSAVFRGGMNIVGAGDTGIKGILQLLPDYNNNVIIFDDLERCCCPINEVLGYINNFVEHSDASVILVANEEEIGKWQLDRNPEMQTLIAMDFRVNVDLPPTMEDFIRDANHLKTPKKETFTPEEIEYRRRAIFHSNEEYKAIKEKVIGLTINYDPDLSPILRKLIDDNIKDEVLKDQLVSETEWFVSTAVKDAHNNLRTFQYFLEKISMIFEVIGNDYPTLHQYIIHYAYRSSIRYMKGQKMPEWNEEYGTQVFGEEKIFNSDQEFGFKFIDDLIMRNTIDADNVQALLDRFSRLVEKRGQLSNDPSQLIKSWWTYEDRQIAEWLDTIEKNVKKGIYSTELYTELIRYMAELKAHHIQEEKCDSIFSAMKYYINAANPSDLELLDRERFILEGDTCKIYNSMLEEISVLIEAGKTQSEKQKYEEAISNTEHWATNLVSASENAGNLQGHSFVYWLEPEEILIKIEESDNAELHQFRNALQCVYDAYVYYENKNDDYEHLKELQEGVREMDTSDWGEVKRAYQDWIVNDIGRYLEKIEPDNNMRIYHSGKDSGGVG